ncbi:MAG TPA: 4-(cytidine 5'-diphospho)-2-C-methyl-D-erythritol kinase [Gemmataceae bacterium]|nr:4-(cytidine 5'-diphospho)-2-C-methyl-D-erythritol kinase [Gemmataceae bacterium]
MIVRHGPAGPADPDPVPPDSVRVLAPAKVNLFLEVLGRRPDGYHEVATLMVAIDLADVLDFAPARPGDLSLTCDDPDLSCGPDNLVMRAAERLRTETGCTSGARIRLAKRIPRAAGLGGGSSDAAAALVGLNELWKLGLSPASLARLGTEIGSDVPFFLDGPAAWCTGRGDVVTPVPVGPALDLVLVQPAEGLSTADVYRRVTVPASPLDGGPARVALAAGDVEALGRALHNRLQEPAFALAPAVADLHCRLLDAGPAGALMTGSGSCLFALCRNPTEARRVHDDLSRGWAPGGVSPPRTFLVRSRP